MGVINGVGGVQPAAQRAQSSVASKFRKKSDTFETWINHYIELTNFKYIQYTLHSQLIKDADRDRDS